MSQGVVVQVRHNFETAHRLPFLPGKCQSLHGHSWWTDITLKVNVANGWISGMDENGISTEYGKVKGLIRDWIDTNLDHGTMLGYMDPLVGLLYEANDPTKLFVFGQHTPREMPWPTVEAVATLLQQKVQAIMDQSDGVGHIKVVAVKVQETAVNSAIVGLAP